MNVCNGASPIDFQNSCIRATWGAVLPAAVVFAICLFSLPCPRPLRKLFGFIEAPFRVYMTLPEAEALSVDPVAGDKVTEDDESDLVASNTVPLWRTVIFAFVGLVEALSWLILGSFRFVDTPNDPWSGILPILMSATWVYTIIRPIAHPSATATYDLFSIYGVHLGAAFLQLGGVVYDHSVLGESLPSTPVMIAMLANLLALLGLLGVVLSMPLDIPSKNVRVEDIGLTVSPDDYTTLWGWLTFSWVYPLVKRGKYTTLDFKDVWALSPIMQSRPVFIKFNKIRRSTLFRRLWAANSRDLILDFLLTFCSVVFNYAGPFFLKGILDAIDLKNRTPESQSRAYIYAFLAFICALCRAQTELQHLWVGRRAATRLRSSLIASLYDKALKRKDFSGIIDRDKQDEATAKRESLIAERTAVASGSTLSSINDSSKRKAKEKAATADDPKAGADVGKIVNLMAGDTTRMAQVIIQLNLIYGAPFEILIASIFLYQLLGWSAFAGFVVLLVGWPLNSYIMKRSVRIQKGVLAARDKRMGVLNELIGAVKFIKFFAWEERWIGRALNAREVEMQWMIKARINSVMFYLLWTSAPIFVSIISFFVYVMQGKELTIGIAFTSIALFNMIRQPLNVIPTWIVQILQARVALNRIATYLDEDEVSDQVSSLKQDRSHPNPTAEPTNESDSGFGIINASFKWNEVEEVEEDGQPKDSSTQLSSNRHSTATSDSATDVGSDVSVHTLDHRFELRDINVMFPEGELSLITGPTASGKTALLMALLGEMTMLPGDGKLVMSKNASKVDEHGLMHSMSYAAQSPWLRHQSIKDNILFGYPYDEERYNAVIECCALKPDLEVLEDGDKTEIGSRGVSLSGGQKARVALARAVYARTKYMLLDDPLSAVDSHTSRFLFEKLLCGPLLSHRTVILVTHHVELVLPGAHYIVRMLDGRIDTQGTVKELYAQGILDDIKLDAAAEIPTAKDASTVEDMVAEDPSQPTEATKPRKLITEEHREHGGVKWSIYKSYLKASSYWIWGFLVMLVFVVQLLVIGEKVWIMIWGEAYGSASDIASRYTLQSFANLNYALSADGHMTPRQHVVVYEGSPVASRYTWPSAVERPLFYIGVFAAIGLTNALVSVLTVTAQYTAALRASRILFKQLLETVVRATFRFHDTTPQGRMLNRFGKDIETIDSSLAGSIQAVNFALANFLASILTVAVVFPYFLVPAFFIGLAYRELAIGYLNTGRDLRRMESNTRSPMYSDFAELLEGIVTVRAFSAEQRFLNNLHKKNDTTTKMWYTFWMTNRWLLLNFDTLGALAVLVTTLFSIAAASNGAGYAGLCITSAMAFTMSVYWACRFWTALELDLNSVERIVEYLDLPQEPPAVIESNRVPAYWPSSANNDSLITVENLVVKYAPDLPAVLQDVSFTLKAGERIGLLGRTGSGKSTLAMSILRFVDPVEGRILIDGIDISTIGIHDLRSRLTFIPQDATLFSGTLRENLDPFGEHEDQDCLDVLYRVQMINRSPLASQGTSRAHSPSLGASRPPSVHGSTTDSLSTALTDIDAKTTVSLDTQVSAGGTNFSQGQRQLIAMARALLRRSSIIVLDEATSSIDFAADAKVQATIREQFTDSLLLTVAHRLRTVIDYDRLLVLDKGQIAEFDTPWRLIQKEDGIFRNMCLKSGSFGELEAAAKAQAEKSSQ